MLCGGLDARFAALFDRYAADHPLPAAGNAQLDGRLFGDWLVRRDALPSQALLERMGFDLRYRVSGGRVLARAGFRLLVRRCGEPRRWLIALRLPGAREYWWGLRRG